MPSRRHSRELAMQALFSIELGKHTPAEAIEQVVGTGDDSATRKFTKDLVLGTLENVTECDSVIVPLLHEWTLDRLPIIDRIVLRMAVYEMRHFPETPAAVVVNEAIEMVKRFSTDESGKFVNGVLAQAMPR